MKVGDLVKCQANIQFFKGMGIILKVDEELVKTTFGWIRKGFLEVGS